MTKTATLHRLETSDAGTFGILHFGSDFVFSGELPWRHNEPNVSCIPPGLYRVLWTWSPAFKRKMYLVSRVAGRSGIRIHPGNYMGARDKGYKSHLYGCIALGEQLGWMDAQRALLISRPAVSRLEAWGNCKTFELEIVDA